MATRGSKPEGIRNVLTTFEKQGDLYAPEAGPPAVIDMCSPITGVNGKVYAFTKLCSLYIFLSVIIVRISGRKISILFTFRLNRLEGGIFSNLLIEAVGFHAIYFSKVFIQHNLNISYGINPFLNAFRPNDFFFTHARPLTETVN